MKNSDKSKYLYSSYGIVFDGAGSWSSDNDLARNNVIFGVDESSSSHVDNCQNNFLVLEEEPADGINGSVRTSEKKFSVNFTTAKTKFCFSLRYSGDNSYLLFMGKI